MISRLGNISVSVGSVVLEDTAFIREEELFCRVALIAREEKDLVCGEDVLLRAGGEGLGNHTSIGLPWEVMQ